jgi:hypothetical protein
MIIIAKMEHFYKPPFSRALRVESCFHTSPAIEKAGSPFAKKA